MSCCQRVEYATVTDSRRGAHRLSRNSHFGVVEELGNEARVLLRAEVLHGFERHEQEWRLIFLERATYFGEAPAITLHAESARERDPFLADEAAFEALRQRRVDPSIIDASKNTGGACDELSTFRFDDGDQRRDQPPIGGVPE